MIIHDFCTVGHHRSQKKTIFVNFICWEIGNFESNVEDSVPRQNKIKHLKFFKMIKTLKISNLKLFKFITIKCLLN